MKRFVVCFALVCIIARASLHGRAPPPTGNVERKPSRSPATTGASRTCAERQTLMRSSE